MSVAAPAATQVPAHPADPTPGLTCDPDLRPGRLRVATPGRSSSEGCPRERRAACRRTSRTRPPRARPGGRPELRDYSLVGRRFGGRTRPLGREPAGSRPEGLRHRTCSFSLLCSAACAHGLFVLRRRQRPTVRQSPGRAARRVRERDMGQRRPDAERASPPPTGGASAGRNGTPPPMWPVPPPRRHGEGGEPGGPAQPRPRAACRLNQDPPHRRHDTDSLATRAHEGDCPSHRPANAPSRLALHSAAARPVNSDFFLAWRQHRRHRRR
jgi:hypothetical protein